jgi:hypothetical protein
LQDLRLRLSACRRSNRLVSVDLRCDERSNDTGGNQREQGTCRYEPLLVPSPARFGPPKLVPRVWIDRLEDGPGRGQGVEN